MFCHAVLKAHNEVQNGEVMIEKHIQQEMEHFWSESEGYVLGHDNLVHQLGEVAGS